MFESLLGKFGFRSLEDPTKPLTDRSLVDDWGMTRGGHGQIVSPKSALQLSAVWACVRVLAETVSTLPLHVYKRREDGGRDKAPDHPIYEKLHLRPNELQSAVSFWEMVVKSVATWGWCPVRLVWSKRGPLLSLWPLDPSDWDLVPVEGRNTIWLARKDQPEEVIPMGHFMHFSTMGDGYRGLSPIASMERSIGTTMAAEEYGADFYGSGATLGSVVKSPVPLKPEIAKRLRKQFEESYSGRAGNHATLVLENGMDFERVGLPPEDALFLETRKYGAEDIARIYRIPPHMIGILEKATFSNIEQQSLDFVMHTMRPWLVRLEQVINWYLFNEGERGTYYAEFNAEGLLRGDMQSRSEFYRSAVETGWMNRNEVREKENMNREEGLDEFLSPMNMNGGDEEPDAEGSKEQEEKSDRAVDEKNLEHWEQRSADVQTSLRATFEGVFKQAFARVIAEDVKKIQGDLRNLGDGSWSEFVARTSQYLEQSQESVADEIEAIVLTYGARMIDELDVPEAGREKAREQLAAFAEKYGTNAASMRSAMEMRRLEKAWQGGEVEQVFADLATWNESLPAERAHTEAVRAGGALARMVFNYAGFTYLVWRTIGETCSICSPLNGITVGVRENFFNAGDVIEPGGDVSPIRMNENIGHPPVHPGCDCVVTAR